MRGFVAARPCNGASRQAAHYTDEGARWTGPAPHVYNGVLDERP
jgi:hypothetical protein